MNPLILKTLICVSFVWSPAEQICTWIIMIQLWKNKEIQFPNNYLKGCKAKKTQLSLNGEKIVLKLQIQDESPQPTLHVVRDKQCNRK